MRCLALLAAASAACDAAGGGGLTWEGTPGRATPASFDQWVPGVDGWVDGDPGHLLVDTGAPLTLLDVDAYPAVEPGVRAIDLVVGDLRFVDLEVVAGDPLPEDQARRPPLAGVLGGDLLGKFALSLDYQGGRLWLEDGEVAVEGLEPDAVAPAVELAARVEGGGLFELPDGGLREVGATRFLLRARAEAQPADQASWILVDTGASAVVASRRLMDRLGDAGRPELRGVSVATPAGPVPATLSRLWRLDLRPATGDDGGAALDSVPVLILPDDALFDSVSAEVGREVDAILGGSYLRWFATTLDFPGERIVLRRYTSPTHVDPDEYVGVGFTLATRGGAWEIAAVLPDTDADDAGLVAGEVVVALGGTSLGGRSVAEVEAILGALDRGDELRVSVERAGEVVDVPVAVEDLLPPFEAPS